MKIRQTEVEITYLDDRERLKSGKEKVGIKETRVIDRNRGEIKGGKNKAVA